jgi:hypothetical protein
MRKAWAALALVCALRAGAAGVSAPPENDVEHNARREQEFAAFDPHFQERKAERVAVLRELAGRVQERENTRQNTTCAHQILWELKLAIGFSADFTAIDRRIRDLRAILEHPEREIAGDRQNPEDGSWGSCFDAWHLKLMASYEHRRDQGAMAFRFLNRVNSPEKLTNYIMPLATSDIARTGIDHAYEMNESLSDLMRLILRDQPKDYPWDPKLKQTMLDLLLHHLRNPDTGWWGERYVRDGRAKFVDDLSMTFHTVSYLDGKVPEPGRIVDTALALKSVDTPAGWLWKNGYWNHNNMDVAVLFQYGWPQATETQRAAMKTELEKMMRWCLAESLQPDGSFRPILPDGSIEEANYFGAVFLVRSGYFDRARRFWTNAEFPGADAVRKRILDNVNRHRKSGGAGGGYYASILEELR